MFRRFWLDVILGTVFIFGLMFVFQRLTTLKIFDLMDPIGDAFQDMEFTDIYFSQLLDDPIADEDVVLVNIGNVDRATIGMMIDSISQHNPRVIGVDSFFDFPKEDTLGDMILSDALGRVENLVMAGKVLYNPYTDEFDSIRTSWPWFTYNSDTAHVNLITDAEDQEDLKMCRTFAPLLTTNDGKTYRAFAVKLAEYYAPIRTEFFLERAKEEEIINYKGNVLDYGASKFGTKYYALDVPDVFNSNYVPEVIEGKVVIFCYLGEYLGDRKNFEDKFFTPLNETYIGRAFPDMYGGVIHANIVSMIIHEDYMTYLSDSQTLFITILFAFLNITVFVWIYKKLPNWYDGITKLIQTVELLAIPFLMIFILDRYGVKLDLTILLFAIALSGDGLEVFFGVVKNSFTKKGRKELFKVNNL